MPRPNWDKEARKLTYNGKLVRRFKGKGKGMTFLVLDCFEEDDWPETILCPIKPRRGVPYDQIIRESVQSLNDSFRDTVLHFYSDSKNESIGWRLRDAATGTRSASAKAGNKATADGMAGTQ